MFEYLEPDASGASNLPPSSHSTSQVRPERVRHMLYGSLAGIDRTIKILHTLGYTDPNDWSDPIPVPPTSGTPDPTSPAGTTPASSGAEMWMAIATKTVLIE
ncbi:hypothetical protein [Nodosilinea sp. FACHB-13]|uniref:hypothetical protein n=1 Tax=Cyanophyceae TaxID=3028117 RepID=UPI0016883DC8|nr:hypothetical protein [Nodosilinea sp. FACHB-13]MBD2106864.1 hypothetical protein [Nodosilinea sp. FACHB-13]